MASATPAERPLELTSAGTVRAASKPQLDALTGIRFIAAVLVVLAHVEMLWHIFALPGFPPAMQAWSARGDHELLGIAMPGYEQDNGWHYFVIRGIVLGAYVALDLFFILSGFVLTYTCMDEGGQLRVERGGFWATRIARIYPVYLVGLFIYIPLFLFTTGLHDPPYSRGQIWGMVAATLGLVQAWWPDAANAWNPPAWSLSAEAFFYLLFPFLLVWIDRLKRSHLWAILVLAYVAMLIPSTVYVLLRPDPDYQMEWLGEGYWLRLVKYNPLIRLPEFVAGMALGKLFSHKAVQNARAGISSRGWLAAVALAGMLGGMCLTYYLPYPLMHNGVLLPFVALFIYDLAMGGGPIGRFFASRPMVLLGNSTYCIYILHASFLGYAMGLVLLQLGGEQEAKYKEELAKYEQAQAAGQTMAEPVAPDLSKISPDSVDSPMRFLVVMSVVLLVCSVLMHKFYEEPCRRYLRRRLSRRAHLAIPPPAKAADLP